MKRFVFGLPVVISLLLSIMVVLTVLAGNDLKVKGKGEAVAQVFVAYDSGGSIFSFCNVSAADAAAMGVNPADFTGNCTVGNDFTFKFKGKVDDGKVKGKMSIEDPTLGLVIKSTVDLLVLDPRVRAGFTGSGSAPQPMASVVSNAIHSTAGSNVAVIAARRIFITDKPPVELCRPAVPTPA